MVKTTSVYMVSKTPEPHMLMFCPVLSVGTLLWLHSSRRSSIGGSIGEFSLVWEKNGWRGPRSQRFNLHMDYVSPVYDEPKVKGRVIEAPLVSEFGWSSIVKESQEQKD